jgi:glycogen debranching enzyme
LRRLKSDSIRIDDQWYISATVARADETPQVIKSGDTFGLFDRFGDVRTWGTGEQGLYHEDTRYLSQLELTIDGVRPLYLGSAVQEGNNLLVVELMNPDLIFDGRLVVPKGEVHVFRAKLLWEGACHEHIRLRHHGMAPAALELGLNFDADFVDLFEVRGTVRESRGVLLPSQTHAAERVFRYRGRDKADRATRVRLTPAPTAWTEQGARYVLELQPHEDVHLYCSVVCDTQCEGSTPSAELDYDAAYQRNSEHRAAQRRTECAIRTSNPLMNRWLDRSSSDLAMLTTELPTGPYPYAGVPWYSTTFGRDGLITAREMLWVDPSLARGVLAHLAATQATTEEPQRDAEPGKILHEARQCEMARTGEVPFGRYYGTIDATPLFVALAGAYYRRTGDLEFIRGIWPNVMAALDWIDRYGDRDGDGFVEYARRSETGLVQQGWKDSHDSIFHADGSLAVAPIALCEVQAYVYEAKQQAADLAVALHQPELATRLLGEAQALRTRFQSTFWCEEIGTYAIALDGEKRPCRVASSNAGHAMWTGIASPEHAARMAQRFLDPDFFTGWGIRTIAGQQSRYNPMSYHNGSIWPHDNALIAVGLGRYGHREAAMTLLGGLFDASTHFTQHRLPELFCGFPRRQHDGPTLYPVACAPQAWAAAAVFAMLQACLGLELDAPCCDVALRAPRLPEFIDWLELRDLRVGDTSVDLLLKRYDRNVGVEVLRKGSQPAVRVLV